MPPVTVYDICAKSGVSVATVSRVLNDSEKVSQATRRKVLDAAYQLGYTPSFAARSLAKQKSDLIGAIFPRMASGFFADVLCGLDAGAKEGGFHLLTAFSHDEEDEQRLSERFVRQGLVGALIVMNFRLDDRFLAHLSESGIPVVSLDGPSPEISSASIDNGAGMEHLLTHLAELGHRRAAVLLGQPNAFDSRDRLAACRQLAGDLGIGLPAEWLVPGGFNEAGGYEAARALLARGEAPTAIVAFNDLMALGAIRALREAGLRVPEDVSVTGFDDIELAAPFALTTVRVPMFELGRMAGEIAATQMKGDRTTVHRTVRPSLAIRGTCAPPRA